VGTRMRLRLSERSCERSTAWGGGCEKIGFCTSAGHFATMTEYLEYAWSMSRSWDGETKYIVEHRGNHSQVRNVFSCTLKIFI